MTVLLMSWTLGASAADVDFECSPGNSAGVVGVPPLDVTCTVVPPATGTYDAVTWTFGDGTVQKGDSSTFTYQDVGRYTVTVRLENFVDPADPDAVDPRLSRHEFVTVCGVPEPSFEVENLGGLDYALNNTSEIAPRCLDQTLWSVFEGSGAQGEPIFTSTTWSPSFTFASEGTFTVTLDNVGVAGTRSAEQTLQAEYRLADRVRELDPYACAVTPPIVAFGSLGFVMIAALVRRRT